MRLPSSRPSNAWHSDGELLGTLLNPAPQAVAGSWLWGDPHYRQRRAHSTNHSMWVRQLLEALPLALPTLFAGPAHAAVLKHLKHALTEVIHPLVPWWLLPDCRHPDKNANSEESTEKFQKINAACKAAGLQQAQHRSQWTSQSSDALHCSGLVDTAELSSTGRSAVAHKAAQASTLGHSSYAGLLQGYRHQQCSLLAAFASRLPLTPLASCFVLRFVCLQMHVCRMLMSQTMIWMILTPR